jgi:CRISPR-associated protein Csb1
MLKALNSVNRVLMEAELIPVQGHRFQPTGFADLGAATYQAPDGTRMLLVESAQSMANRFEQAVLGPDNELLGDLEGLPYIRARLSGDTETTTNSLIEAHRINSPYIIQDDTFKANFKQMSEYERYQPINWQKVARAVFHYDVNSLLHGVFLANLEDGRIKIPRSLSAFIEAKGVREAVSGGVKTNPIDPTGKMRTVGYDKDVYGNVPYQRVEYIAEETKAYFNIDVGLLRSYGLGDDALNLLIALGFYKILSFLDGGTRLRTACDLKQKGDLTVMEPGGFGIPKKDKLLEFIKGQIGKCKDMFAKPPVTVISTQVVLKKAEEPSE